jgi:DUF971 family protein
MNVFPTKLERLSDGQLRIEWNDRQQRCYTVQELRKACPCATCREKISQKGTRRAPLLPIITEAEMKPLTIARMKPVGNYAYSIDFSDGHDTGIYTLELLRELGRPV